MTNDENFYTTYFFAGKKKSEEKGRNNQKIMVLMINGVPLEEAPRDVPAFLTQYPHFKESASRLDIV